jgi:hypothetical protein
MKFILSKLSNLFRQRSQLEEFILSKNPLSASDVDHWTRVFNHSQHRWL